MLHINNLYGGFLKVLGKEIGEYPSCVLWKIRDTFPELDGQYTCILTDIKINKKYSGKRWQNILKCHLFTFSNLET